MKTQTNKYKYYIKTVNKPIKHEVTYIYAIPVALRKLSYVGTVTTMKGNTKDNEILTTSILCETESVFQSLFQKQPADPIVKPGVLTCPNGTKKW
jgi:hypothetical protein